MASRTPATRPTGADVEDFLAQKATGSRRGDADALAVMMGTATGEQAAMWGPSIVGFGSYHYVYGSGHEGEAPLIGFSPRAGTFAIYLVGGYAERYPGLLARLGPHKAAVGCLYVKRLSEVDTDVLRSLIERSVRVHRGVDRPRAG